MINETLATLDTWFNEASAGPDRPKLLSKLALLELCGWLETEQDRIVLAINAVCLNDLTWVQGEIVEKTYGFDYAKHFRPMLTRMIGEHLVRRLESSVEQKYPGEIAKLKSFTGDLWKKRCAFAHADLLTNVARQLTFDAPSWSLNKHRIISKALGKFESEAILLGQSL